MKTFFTCLALLCACIGGRAAEDVAIIVSKDCKLEELSLADVRLIFRCEKTHSPSGAKWLVLLRAENSPEHATMLKRVFKCDAASLKAYFMQAVFNDTIEEQPSRITSTLLVQRNLSGNVSGISYIRAGEISAGVKALKIDGALPGDAGYPIKTD